MLHYMEDLAAISPYEHLPLSLQSPRTARAEKKLALQLRVSPDFVHAGGGGPMCPPAPRPRPKSAPRSPEAEQVYAVFAMKGELFGVLLSSEQVENAWVLRPYLRSERNLSE